MLRLPWFYGQVIDMFYIDIWEEYLPDWLPIIGINYMSLWPVFNIARIRHFYKCFRNINLAKIIFLRINKHRIKVNNDTPNRHFIWIDWNYLIFNYDHIC